MEKLDFGFWLGLALAIPLSILGNLITPAFQRLVDSTSKKRSKARAEEIKNELNELERLASNLHALNFELLREILFVIFLTAGFGVVVGTMAWLSDLSPRFEVLQYLSRVLAIVSGMMIVSYSFGALIKARNVRHFDKHKIVLNKRLEELSRSDA